MTNDDLKKMRTVIKEEVSLVVKGEIKSSENRILNTVKKQINTALEPVNKRLDSVTKGLDTVTDKLNTVTKNLNILWDQVVVVTADLTEIIETLDSHTILLKAAAKTEQNSENIRKLSKRVTTVEAHAGISTPPELTIAF